MKHKKIMIRMAFKQIYVTLQHSWINILLFEFIYKVLVLVVFKPLINAAIDKFAKAGGYSVLLNEQIGKFFTSAAGVGLLLFLIPIGIVAIYYEFSVLFIFLYAGFQKKKITFSYGLKNGLYSLKTLRHWSTSIFAVYILCLVPSLSIPLYSSLLPGFQVPRFIVAEIFKYPGGSYALDLAMYLPIIVYIALCFVTPVMALERSNFGTSLKRNFYILKGNVFRIVFILLITFACWGILTLLLFGIDSSAPPLLFSTAGILIDLLQIFSTPLLLSAILVCYVPNAEIVEIDDGKMVTKDTFLMKIWDRFMPTIIKRRPAVLWLLLIIPAYINTFYQDYSIENKNTCLIIGHRGSWKGVENSIQAVLGAWEEGADYAEIDILLSADQVPMVIHDDNLFRLSGKVSSVHDLTAEELQNTVLTQDGIEANIPTLDALCKAVKGKMKILVELKSHGHETVSVVERVAEVLLENGMAQNCIFQTSEYALIEEMKVKYPDFSIGYVLISSLGDVSTELAQYESADFLSVEYSVITKEMVDACHEIDKPIYIWTVNDEDRVLNLIHLGIDGIITDFPKSVSQTVSELMAIN